MKTKSLFYSMACVVSLCFIGCDCNLNNPKSSSYGALPGVFSVSENTKIRFSRGNLQYQPSTNIWSFAENQLNYIGENNESIASNYTGWIDLFGWGTSGYGDKMPWMSSDRYSDYISWEKDIANTNYDWGIYCTINNGALKKWRTLSADEWEYLFTGRKNGNQLHGLIVVGNTKGFIIFPDNTDPSNTPKMVSYNWDENVISIEEWKKFEQEYHAVFLPAAGYREGKIVYNAGSGGYYWTSSNSYDSDSHARNFYFIEYEQTVYMDSRDTGCAVRLVQDVK